MNAVKIDINKILDGSETSRDQDSKLNNKRIIFNFPLSPKNKNVKSINLGNIKPLSKNESKGNSSDKIIKNNINKKLKQNSTNSFKNLNYNSNVINNNIDQIKKLELKEKDTNNLKEYKAIKAENNDSLGHKDILNNKIKAILFQNNNIKLNNNNNLLIKTKQKFFNNFDNPTTNLLNINEINQKDLASIKEIKNKPFFIKLEPKKNSSILKGKILNKNIKQYNDNHKNLSSKFINEEEIKRIKTPTKKLFHQNEKNNAKESLSEYINLDNNIDGLNRNIVSNIKNKNAEKIYPEENHFKAVLYSQEIKKFNNRLE